MERRVTEELARLEREYAEVQKRWSEIQQRLEAIDASSVQIGELISENQKRAGVTPTTEYGRFSIQISLPTTSG